MYKLIYKHIADGLRSIPQLDARDVYVVSLYVADLDDDPRRPTVTLGFNTESNLKAQLAGASDLDEARWNFAFWLQNEIVVLGGEGQLSTELSAWRQELSLDYTDAEEQAELDHVIDLGTRFTEHFVEACCLAVRELHARGAIESTFGRPIPVLVHELEYYDSIAEQNVASNPPGLCADFARWIYEM